MIKIKDDFKKPIRAPLKLDQSIPTVLLIGFSGVGKSFLANAITGAKNPSGSA